VEEPFIPADIVELGLNDCNFTIHFLPP
jgi:hypothetical protein